MKAKLEDPVALAREIVREYCRGDPEPMLARLCPGSVWVGTGERTIFGGDAIRAYFSIQGPRKPFRIFQEEYHAIPVSARAALVVIHVTVGTPKSESARLAVSGLVLFQLLGAETKLVAVHFSHGFLRGFRPEQESSLTWVPAYHLYRNLLLDVPETGRLPVPSGGRTFYIHPNSILYARSRNRRAELYCVDTVVRSDLTITEMNRALPEEFCAIHRCYTVNARFVSAIQRYKVTMVTGEALPVPAEAYNRVKAELERRISGVGKRAEPPAEG